MKKSITMLLAAALLLSLWGCGAAETETTPETVSVAETLAPALPETILETTETVYDVTTWQGNYELGLSYLDSKQWQLAYDAFDAAVALDPQKPDAYAQRGLALVRWEETKENLSLASTDYQQALSLDDGCALAYRGIADVHIRRGEYDEAEAVVKDAWEKTNEDPVLRPIFQQMQTGDFYDSSNMIRFLRRKHYYQEKYLGRVDTTYDENGNGKLAEVFDAEGKLTHSIELGVVTDGNTKVQTSYTTHVGESTISITKRINTTITNPDGSYEYETVSFNKAGERSLSSREWYDTDRRMVRRENYDAAGQLRGYSTSEYDEAGNEIRCNHYNPDGTLDQYNLFEYNSDGWPLREEYRDAGGNLLTYILHVYDENGILVAMEAYSADGVLQHSSNG